MSYEEPRKALDLVQRKQKRPPLSSSAVHTYIVHKTYEVQRLINDPDETKTRVMVRRPMTVPNFGFPATVRREKNNLILYIIYYIILVIIMNV